MISIVTHFYRFVLFGMKPMSLSIGIVLPMPLRPVLGAASNAMEKIRAQSWECTFFKI